MSEATMTRRERVARAIVDSHVAIHGVTWPAMSEIQQSWYLECADAAIAAYEAVLAEEGMVIVPREATPSMVAALDAGMNMNEVWRAMIAAWLAERG